LILVGTCNASAPETWSSKWASHEGAFPGDMVLGAKCLLDWIGPTAAATLGAANDIIQITQHPPEEVSSWQATHAMRSTLSPQQMKLAGLEQLDSTPPPNEAANAVIERLQTPYKFSAFTHLPAAEAVTTRSKRVTPGRAGPTKPTTRELPRPRFLSEQAVSPADIGTATHLVLQHLDFSRMCDADDVDAQIASMVERNLVQPKQAEILSRDAILWMLNSEVGTILKANAQRLHREIAIHFALPAPDPLKSDDPQDRVMIRGRVDVLVPTGQGTILIDYKTDNISATLAPLRAQDYALQMQQYRQAVEKITGAAVAKTYFVFLAPRVVVES
jgi:ATP-dependent helicase/nuclease subunit A